MAITNEKSAELTLVTGTPASMVEVFKWHGRLRVATFKHTQGAAAGDIGSTADLVKLPAGSVRVIGALSKIYFRGNTALTTMDVGTRAFKKLDGTTNAELATAYVSAFAVGAGTVNTPLDEAVANAGTFHDTVHQSQDGVTIFAKVAGAVWAVGAVTEGFIVYVLD